MYRLINSDQYNCLSGTCSSRIRNFKSDLNLIIPFCSLLGLWLCGDEITDGSSPLCIARPGQLVSFSQRQYVVVFTNTITKIPIFVE